MYETIRQMARKQYPEAVKIRRLLHRRPELGWCEFSSTALVARRLRQLGFQVLTGPAVCQPAARMGVPPEEALERAWRQALEEGTPEEEMAPMRGGFTGAVAVFANGPGPVAALRCDLDALPIQEETGLPFASEHPGVMHACGHDGHTAMGLGVASILRELSGAWSGTLKLIFQPAEEGVRGGRAVAVTALYGIPRHSAGATRVNVGRMEAGSGRNVAADWGKLELEVRGATTQLNGYMEEQARRILQGAAQMQGVFCDVQMVGGAPSVESSPSLCQRIWQLCRQEFPEIRTTSYLQGPSEGSEDISWMMERVKARGGEAAFPLFLTDTAAPGHTPRFDFPESVLLTGMTVLAGTLYSVLKQ